MSSKYFEKLKDPRWQKKRLEILQRDNWECQSCGDKDKTLHVHHMAYKGKDPWETPDNLLVTLCEFCHEFESMFRPGVEKEIIKALSHNKFLHDRLTDILFLIDSFPDSFKSLIDPIIWALQCREDLIEYIANEYEKREKNKI